jgi:hypothetical protein
VGEINAARLKAERAAGQIVPALEAVVSGSFTYPRGSETAYVVRVGECLPVTRNYFGTYRLIVFSGDRLAANVEVQANHLLTIADIKGDGVDELLMGSSSFGRARSSRRNTG